MKPPCSIPSLKTWRAANLGLDRSLNMREERFTLADTLRQPMAITAMALAVMALAIFIYFYANHVA